MNNQQLISNQLISLIAPGGWNFVGSQVTCSPPPPLDADKVNTGDVDILVLTTNLKQFRGFAKGEGWVYDACSSCGAEATEADMSAFNSFKKTIGGVKYNLIVTDLPSFNEKFLYATEIAKRLNLMKKQTRINLFQIVLYGDLAEMYELEDKTMPPIDNGPTK